MKCRLYSTLMKQQLLIKISLIKLKRSSVLQRELTLLNIRGCENTATKKSNANALPMNKSSKKACATGKLPFNLSFASHLIRNNQRKRIKFLCRFVRVNSKETEHARVPSECHLIRLSGVHLAKVEGLQNYFLLCFQLLPPKEEGKKKRN